MLRYIVWRIALAIPTLVGVATLVFVVVRLLPGDAVDQIVGAASSGSTRQVADLKHQVRQELGLDKPAVVQYFQWLGHIGKGDFGTSLYSKADVVRTDVGRRLPKSIELGVLALVVAFVIGVPIGIISAAKRDSAADYTSRGIAVLALSVPYFWTATLVVVFGAKWFGWTPPLRYSSLWSNPWANLELIGIPAVLLGISGSGQVLRVARTELIEVLSQDYIRTAKSKGLRNSVVLWRHALRNAMIPVVSVIGTLVPVYLGGIVALELVFGIPGVGTYLLDALQHRDYPEIEAVAIVLSLLVVASNLIVDIVYGYIDPRVSYQEQGAGHGAG